MNKLVILGALLGLAACSSSAVTTTPKSTPDAVLTDGAADAFELDCSGQSGDGCGDKVLDVGPDTTPIPICTMVTPTEAAPDVTRKKFAVSIFHFNIEYVLGGLDYTLPDGTRKQFLNKVANLGWDNDKVEDYIVEQTFMPLLQMYDKHPGWGADFEMQAYMVEVIGKRHPQVMELMRKLAQRGQIELISFHYAAQFFLAFPKEDLHRSLVRTREVFAQYCLPLSGVVFNQEGQAGEGRQKMLVEEGYSIGVYPKNLWKYQHGEAPQGYWPLYSSEGGDLIAGGSGVDGSSGIALNWNYMDDGELAAVGETSAGPYNPYFAPDAPTDPARVAAFEQELANAEKDGFFVARVSDYVRHLHAEKIEAKPAPALLDGTWQAPSTNSVHKWLGGRGIQPGMDKVGLGTDEADNPVRAGNMQARTDAAALQLMADVLAQQGKTVPGLSDALRGVWEDVWHAEVSDASGINPWWAEVHYGLDHNDRIAATCASWRAKILPLFGKTHVQVNLGAGTVTPVDGLPGIPAMPTVDAPFEVTVTAATGRSVSKKWQSGGPGSYWLTVDIGPSTCGEDCFANELSVSFPRYEDVIRYSPALIEDQLRSYPFSAFNFVQGEAWLPLANGLIGLGKGWYAIKATRSVHVAARVAPKDATIVFADETLRDADTATWKFLVIKGDDAAALKAADELNLHPTLWY